MLFTKENAAIHGRAGAIARWSQPRQPQIAEPPPQPTASLPANIADSYQVERLVRVRGILNTLDARLATLAEEGDPKDVRDLASALSPISEQEFWLSGRAKPGNTKPAARQPVRSTMITNQGPPEPVTPQPVAVEQSTQEPVNPPVTQVAQNQPTDPPAN